MKNLSIRLLLTGMVLLLGVMAIGLSANSLIRRFNNKNTAQTVASYSVIDRNLFLGLSRLRNDRGYGSTALQVEPNANRKFRDLSINARAGVDESVAAAAKGLAVNPIPELAAMGRELGEMHANWMRMRPEIDKAFDLAVSARDKALVKQFVDSGIAMSKVLDRRWAAPLRIRDPIASSRPPALRGDCAPRRAPPEPGAAHPDHESPARHRNAAPEPAGARRKPGMRPPSGVPPKDMMNIFRFRSARCNQIEAKIT